MSDDSLRAALGEAWDDGNATGLDGYVGPGRGAGEVDPEAVHARERVIEKLAGAHPAESVPIAARERVAEVLVNSLAFEDGMARGHLLVQIANRCTKALLDVGVFRSEAVALHHGDVLAALEQVYRDGAMGGEWPTLGADAVMQLARPEAVVKAEALREAAEYVNCEKDLSFLRERVDELEGKS